MTFQVQYSIASNPNRTRGQFESYGRLFKARATGVWGNELTVAVLAEGIDATHEDQATWITVSSIYQYFRSHLTSDVVVSLTDAIKEANSSIYAKRKDGTLPASDGAYVTVLAIAGDRFFVAGVGQGRVYLIREDQARQFNLNRTWRIQPPRMRDGRSEDPPIKDASVLGFLGESQNVDPQFAPMEYVWQGDNVALVTTQLADHITLEQVGDLASGVSPEELTKKLVQAGMEAGGAGNLTAMVLGIPQPASQALPIPVERETSKLTTGVKALIIGNLLLFLVIAALMLRSGNLIELFAPSTSVEVARPALVPTSTVVPPPAGLDAPLEATPSSTPSIPSPSSPAAAPTSGPGPTFTPMPLPQGWRQPGPLIPIQPANGAVFAGPDAAVVLAWNQVQNLAEDMFYVVDIRKFVDGKLVGESRNWTRSTRIRLDSSFYTAQLLLPGRIDVSAMSQAAKQGQFQWNVSLYRLTQVQTNGVLTGDPISPPSKTMTFTWGPPLLKTPTRVYGSENLKTDPFFQEEQQRQAAADATLFPISAGMAGFWLVLGGLVAAPKLAIQLRRRTSRRSRF